MNKKIIIQLLYCITIIPCSVILLILVMIAGSCSTTKPKHFLKSDIGGLQDSLLVDRDGNKYYIRKMLDNNHWMTTNLKLNIPGSYCYGNADNNCERYGRLYTWEAAQNGCALLGEGWRLPTNDEWQKLAALYGGFTADSIENRKKAYSALMISGNAGFNAVLGGGRDTDGGYRRIEAHGFYWTATENDSLTAWYSNFGKNSQSLYHQYGGEKKDASAVRCIKSIGTLK